MPVLVVGTEKNFTGLRRRLFPGGRAGKAVAARVAAAIRDANPHADLDALRVGTILTIPDLPEITVDTDPTPADTAGAAVEQLGPSLGDALDSVMKAAQAREERDAEERKALRLLLDSGEVRNVPDADLARDVEAVRAAVAAEEEAAATRQEALRRAGEEWRTELDALGQL